MSLFPEYSSSFIISSFSRRDSALYISVRSFPSLRSFYSHYLTSISPEDEGGIEVPVLDCPGVFPAGLLVTVLPDLLGLNSGSISLVDDSGE